MKKPLLLFLGAILAFNGLSASNLLAGYLDTTATGSAATVKMDQAKKDGYNTVIFAFATVNGTNVTMPTLTPDTVSAAKQQGMKTLISLGGQNNTFNPGNLTTDQIQTLAINLINQAKQLGVDGIDFDLEVATDPKLLDALLADIHSQDASLLLTAAPQVVCDTGYTQCQIVTTGSNTDYNLAIQNNRFDYLFVQAYNTPPQNDINFMVKSFPLIAKQLPASSKTKIVMGQPTVAVAAGASTIYHPTPGETLSTKQVTANMLPELKQLASQPAYGGVMGWSLNVDYDPLAYGDTTSHQPGSFAFYLNQCVNNGQCDTQPVMPPTPVNNYQLDVTNDSTQLGIQVVVAGSKHGLSFVTDWLQTQPNSSPQTPNEMIYSAVKPTDPNSKVIYAPSLSPVLDQEKLQVLWFSYVGGKSGSCPTSFDFNQNTHILINADNGDCSIEHY